MLPSTQQLHRSLEDTRPFTEKLSAPSHARTYGHHSAVASGIDIQGSEVSLLTAVRTIDQ